MAWLSARKGRRAVDPRRLRAFACAMRAQARFEVILQTVGR
jgi:hypothetical protein